MKYCAIFLLLLIMVFASACSEYIGSMQPDMRTQNDHIKEFWQWFSKEKTLYETMPDDGYTGQLNDIIAHLDPITSGLAVEVSKEAHGIREIIISADGNKNNFPVVEAIVKGAPKIPGWKAVAFRQKASKEFVLTHQNLRLSPAEMFFYPIIEGDSLDLIIYADSIRNKNRDDVIKYGLITMDNVLGEYTATMRVRSYDFQDSKKIEYKKQVHKLQELPMFVNTLYAAKHLGNKKK